MPDVLDFKSKLRALAASGDAVPLEELCVAYVRAAIDVCAGNKSRAARRLGVSRRALYRWLERGEAA